jgi:hypothetical protein
MAEMERGSEPKPAFAVGAWRELAAGVYLATAEPESVNIGLVVGTKTALLVDTGSSPAQGRIIRESLSSVTDRPLAAVVVTHWHYDHSFGLTAFVGIPTIGHETVRGRLGSSEAPVRPRLGVAIAELAAPSGRSWSRPRLTRRPPSQIAHLGRAILMGPGRRRMRICCLRGSDRVRRPGSSPDSDPPVGGTLTADRLMREATRGPVTASPWGGVRLSSRRPDRRPGGSS